MRAFDKLRQPMGRSDIVAPDIDLFKEPNVMDHGETSLIVVPNNLLPAVGNRTIEHSSLRELVGSGNCLLSAPITADASLMLYHQWPLMICNLMRLTGFQ